MIVLKTKTTDYMTDNPEFYNLPSDVTAASNATEPRSTVGIPEDLLAAVGQHEKSFEDALRGFREQKPAALYLPTKYTTGIRSNLQKQFKVTMPMPGETDKLLGNLTPTGSYVGPNVNDDISVRTDEQSHWSKSTFESKQHNLTLGGAGALLVGRETIESKIIHDESQPETPKHVSPEIEIEDGVPLDNLDCERLKLEIHRNLKMHRLACDYFRFRNFLFFQVTQAILAMASSVLAFMGGSDIFDTGSQKWFTTIAGCCSAMVVFLQTLSGYCGYGLRASMHDGTAIYLRDLDDDLALLASKLIKTEMMEKKRRVNGEPLKQKIQNNEDDTFESLQSRYRHSLKGCKSDVPTQITEAFSEIDSFIMLSRTTTNRKYLRKCGIFESQNFRGITLKSYDRLASNMGGYFYWPLKIPCSKALAKRTIDETRSDLHQMKSFWESPPPKQSPMFCLPFGNGARDKTMIPKFAAI